MLSLVVIRLPKVLSITEAVSEGIVLVVILSETMVESEIEAGLVSIFLQLRTINPRTISDKTNFIILYFSGVITKSNQILC
ncbi:hypothetical protein GCM10023210_11020 [Chryseobacterium ginsengisoli]|uniref:Uncharacterized protein n=1 Tax=Chryseobacterium ginsengisoli TaxID=363853 RepID=A0ABP9M3T9_9FLAO